MKLIDYLFYKVKFAFWVWTSVIGMFVCYCFIYSVFYIGGFFYPPLLNFFANHINHTQSLVNGLILLFACFIGVWEPIKGGLSVVFIVAIITIITAFNSGNYVSIIIWILFTFFSIWSIVRHSPPYHRRFETEELKKEFRDREEIYKKRAKHKER